MAKKASPTENDASEMTKSGVDQDLIRQLAALLKETDLSEIEIETETLRLRVARQLQQAHTVVAAAPAAPAVSMGGAAAAPAAVDATHPGTVASPMVGTAYLAPEPGAPAFIAVGAKVTAGQTLLIVEAMKTMNHIPAPQSGTISKIFVEDGQPVEFGEPLVIIE